MTWNDLIGRHIGKYEILEEIGRGGTSRVFRALDLDDQVNVAIKIIPNDVEDRQNFVARFAFEIEVVQKLHHPNIVAVLGSGETEDLVYLAMEHVKGGTLKDYVAQGLPVGQIASYATQMAQALHHAHQLGIVHRDVKPSNMLVDAEDPRHLLLADFGIAKIQGLRGMTKSGMTIGTPEYMSPEQAEGKESDPRSDIYALGCVVYELLTRRPPFVGAAAVSVLYQHVYTRPTYIRGYNPDVPREFCKVVERALAKDPKHRYADAEEFAREIEPFALAASFPGSALPPLVKINTAPNPYAHRPAEMTPPTNTVPAHSSGALTPAEREAIADKATMPPGESGEPLDEMTPPPAPMPSALASPPPIHSLRQTYGPALARPLTRNTTRPLSSDDLAMEALEALSAHREAGNVPEGQVRMTLPTLPPDVTRSQATDARPAGPLPTRNHALDPDERTQPLPATMASGASGALDARSHEQLTAPHSKLARGPASEELRKRTGSRRVGGGRLIALVVGALALLLIGGAVASANGVGGLSSQQTHARATTTVAVETATSDTTPSVVASPSPDATNTLTAQQQLDRQAFNSFRYATLSRGQDSACAASSSSTTFTSGQTIYINLCTSGHVINGTVAIVIQPGSNQVCALDGGGAPALLTNISYSCFSNFPLGSGKYSMIVTIKSGGSVATARVLPFTIS